MHRREFLLLSLAAFPDAPLLVRVRVLFDAGAHDGRGLTAQERQQFHAHQQRAQREFAGSALRFEVETVEGAFLRTQTYSEIPDQFLSPVRINVFVSDTLRLDADSQRTGGSSIGPRPSRPGVAGSRFYKTFLGLREASGGTLAHEYAHHFVRDTVESPSTKSNFWADFRNDYWLWRQRNGRAIPEFRACAGLPWAALTRRA